MKISQSTIVAWSIVSLSGGASAFSPSVTITSSSSRHSSMAKSTSSSWAQPSTTALSMVGNRGRDLSLLTETPLSEADQERINEKMAIEEVKEFLTGLNYRVADKTKAGTPKNMMSGGSGSGGGNDDGFVPLGDFALDASRSAAAAASADATTTENEEQPPPKEVLPKLRTNLGTSILLSGIFEKQSPEKFDPLLLSLLNANSLVEDSPANFHFEKITALIREGDGEGTTASVSLTKKKVMSREARYNGLLDKLVVAPTSSPSSSGILPTKEELSGVSSWIVHISKEEASTTLPPLTSLISELDELKNVVILVEGVTNEQEGKAIEGWEELKKNCVEGGRVKCTMIAVGELYDGDAYHLYHVGKLSSGGEVDVSAATSASATSTTTVEDEETTTTPKLSRKEAYRILSSALSLESTANQSLYVYERERKLNSASSAISIDPFEELFPFPEYTGTEDDDEAWLAYKKECYAVQEKRKEARRDAEEKLGKEKAAAMEEEQALKVAEGKLPGEEILEDRLIMGMRELGFSRTMELDVLVDSGVKAYKKFIAKPTPLETEEEPDEEWNQPSPEEILIITKNKKKKEEAASTIQNIAYEWARRKYWENEINGDLMLYDPIAERDFVASMKEEAMAFANDYYYNDYRMGRDQTEFENAKAQKAKEVEEREKAIFEKVKRKMLEEMDVDMFATIENLANIENEKKKAEYKYGQEVDYWWIGDPEDPERYQGVNNGPR